MSVSFKILSSEATYAVDLAIGLYRECLNKAVSMVAVCDERFKDDFDKAGIRAIPIKSEETVKSLDAISDVIVALRKAGMTRDTILLAVGGGIVQDVSAFCAAIYMRGLKWIYVPTTLLGMADSCIGGKSSINVGAYKNLVGTFNPPQRVMIDPDFVTTLSPEQIAAGMIEAAKICYCRGPASWQEYCGHGPSLNMKREGFTKIIQSSLTAKKWFIETDEFDRKERLLLNFGHTFGHALEGASDFAISHGIGVGLGMLCAIELGVIMGQNYDAITSVAELNSHIRTILSAVPDLATTLQKLNGQQLFDRFTADKKHTRDNYRVVILNAAGQAELTSLPKTDQMRDQLIAAFEKTLHAYQSSCSAAA